MQRFKQDMSRLRREIVVSRKARQELLDSLTAFRQGLKRDIGEMLTSRHAANAEMFTLAREARSAFVQGIARQVNAMCRSFHADRMNARRAWHG